MSGDERLLVINKDLWRSNKKQLFGCQAKLAAETQRTTETSKRRVINTRGKHTNKTKQHGSNVAQQKATWANRTMMKPCKQRVETQIGLAMGALLSCPTSICSLFGALGLTFARFSRKQ